MNTPDKKTIDRVLSNEATAIEAKDVVHWFSTPEGYAYLSQQIDLDANRITLGKEDQYIDHTIPSRQLYSQIEKKIRKQRYKKIVFRTAAILIPFVLFMGLIWHLDSRVDLFSETEYDEIYVPKGEKLQMLFQDGTKAHLNSETRIRYPRKFGLRERKVILEGEGYFIITKNTKRPFIVDLNGVDIKVAGTSFNVKAYPEEPDVSVVLDEGKVYIEPLSYQPFTLNPGEQAIYNREKKTYKIMKVAQSNNFSAWKKNTILLKDTPLNEVVKILNRWYNVDFVINDSLALQYSYTLKCEQAQLRQVLADLEKISPIQFTEKDGVIYIGLNK